MEALNHAHAPIHPRLGACIRVWWTNPQAWYGGVVRQTRIEAGRRIYFVAYEDGDKKWHDLSESGEIWELVPDARVQPKPAAPSASSGSRSTAQNAGTVDASAPTLGSRIKVLWSVEKRWFKGVVQRTRIEHGRQIYFVVYDDGDEKWHFFGGIKGEVWLYLPGGEKPPTRTAVKEPPTKPAAKPASKPKETPRSRSPPVAHAISQPLKPAKRQRAPLASPPPVSIAPPWPAMPSKRVDVFPCGVVKARGFVSQAQQQELFDTTVIAGWDHRVVSDSNCTAAG